MATIALYAGRINRMPGLIKELRAEVKDFSSGLSQLQAAIMQVDSSVCDLGDTFGGLAACIASQVRALFALTLLQIENESYFNGTAIIDREVALALGKPRPDLNRRFLYENTWESHMQAPMGLHTQSASEWCQSRWGALFRNAFTAITPEVWETLGCGEEYPDGSARVFSLQKLPGFYGANQDRLSGELRSGGCGPAAATNFVFFAFDGKEELFKQTFGFEMYNCLGLENYGKLTKLFYQETDDMYYLNDRYNQPNAATGRMVLYWDVRSNYTGKHDQFQQDFGVELDKRATRDPDGVLRLDQTPSFDAVMEQLGVEDQETIKYEVYGYSQYSLGPRVQHFLNDRGVSCEFESYMIKAGDPLPSSETVSEYLVEGKCVAIATQNFQLYSARSSYDPVGQPSLVEEAHWLTVTGVTPSGDYVVSSWGMRYILKAEDLANSGEDVSYLVVDIDTDQIG